MKIKLLFTLIFSTCIQLAYSQVAIPPLESLVQKYAPLLRHHYAEEYLPSSAEWYLNRSNLYQKIIKPTPPYITIETKADLANNNWEKLWTDAKATENKSIDTRWFIHRKSASTNKGNIGSTKAYVHIQIANYQEYPKYDFDIEIQYWFFWPYNDATDNLGISDHHGDWEGVSVILNSAGQLKYVVTTTHGDRNYYEPQHLEMNAIQFPFAATHPVIYVARKSHALYNKNGKYNKVAGIYRDKVDGRVGVKEVESWNSYEIVAMDPRIEESGIIPTKPKWMLFGGKWGNTTSRSFLGVSSSNSPRFVKYDETEWYGRYNDGLVKYNNAARVFDTNSFTFEQFKIPSDYEMPRGRKVYASITGINSNVCINDDFNLKLNTATEQTVKWNLTSSAFTNSLGTTINGGTFRTSTRSRAYDNASIKAVRTIKQRNGYSIIDTFYKTINVSEPTIFDYDINLSSSMSGGSNCTMVFNLNNLSGIAPDKVVWRIEGGSGTITSSSTFATVVSVPKNHVVSISAEVEVCGKKIKIFEARQASCGGGIGGGPVLSDDDLPLPFSIPIGIFPNPTNGSFKISLQGNLEEPGEMEVMVYDLSGKRVRSSEKVHLNNHTLELNYPDLQSGSYIVRVFSKDRAVYEGRLIKK